MKKPNDSYFLIECIKQVKKKLQWIDSNKWRDKEFEKLSDIIYDTSGIRLSYITLKRLWGKTEYKSVPNRDTLDALSKFIGHENWMDFCVQLNKKNSGFFLTRYLKKILELKKVLIGLLLGLLILFLLYTGIVWIQKKQSVYGDFEFRIDSIKGPAPQTVVIRYDVSSIKADNIYIKKANNKKIELNPDSHIKTVPFEIPTWDSLSLYFDDYMVRKLPVFIKSMGWDIFFETETINCYLSVDSIKEEKNLYVSPIKALNACGIPEKKHIRWVNYIHFKDFHISGDHFEIETKVKNNIQIGGLPFFNIVISVICEKGIHQMYFCQPGNSSHIQVFFNNSINSGHNHDFRIFEKDLSSWNTAKMKIEKMTGKIYFNDSLLYENFYTKKAGSIKGIRYKFRGFGAVDYVRIIDKTSGKIYFDDFE